MSLELPTIDARNYREILAEVLARVPVHNPEWTHLSDSDPGVTLLQLFSFMVESMLYRANLVPERNRRKFLGLLGVPMLPAQAAEGLVSFLAPPGRTDVISLAPRLELTAGPTPFTTRDGVELLPVEGRVFIKARLDAGADQARLEEIYRRVYSPGTAADETLEFYETRPFLGARAGEVLDIGADTVDGCAWIALLAPPGTLVDDVRARLAGQRLSIGVVPAVDDAARVLGPGLGTDVSDRVQLFFEHPRAVDSPDAAAYGELDSRASGPVDRTAVVEVTLPAEVRGWSDLNAVTEGTGDYPPSLLDDTLADRVVSWIRVRLASPQMRLRLGWLGVHASRVVQRVSVRAEPLGTGSGRPEQRARLAQVPVVEGSVVVRVDGAPWSAIDDLAAAPGEVAAGLPRPGETSAASWVFTVDRASGEVHFGDGLHGARPPRGARLVASYEAGGGAAGNVGIDAIGGGAGLPAGVRVTNPVPTWGGTEAESTEAAEKRIPGWLRHRDRLVSVEDHRQLALETPGVEIGRVDVLPLVDPSLPGVRVEGAVTLILVPARDRQQPDAPRPDGPFLEAVCKHLEPKRLVTSELHVRGPNYVPVRIAVGIVVVTGRDTSEVTRAVERAVREFLSPLRGGFEETGWPLGRALDRAELVARAARVSGVAKVTGVALATASGDDAPTLELPPLGLPRIVRLAVQEGLPPGFDATPAEAEVVRARRPVPVVPEGC